MQNITVTAHQSHWASILQAILAAAAAANPILATFIPAPAEAAIQIATVLGPTIVQTADTAGQANP